MRLQMLRTANPAEAGGAWMVMDEDLTAPFCYRPVKVGTAAECGEYIDIADHNATGCFMSSGHEGVCLNDEGDEMSQRPEEWADANAADQAEAEWVEASEHPSYAH